MLRQPCPTAQRATFEQVSSSSTALFESPTKSLVDLLSAAGGIG